MRRAIVALALIGLLAGGCGSEDSQSQKPVDSGPADKTIPLDEYVTRADLICRKAAARALKLEARIGKAASPQATAELLEQQLQIIRDMRADLEALGIPQGKEAVAEEFIAGIRRAEPHLERVIAAMRDGDEKAASEAGQRYHEASFGSARQVQRSGLDFNACGSGV